MKLGMWSVVGALAVTAISVAAPVVAAAPSGSAGFGDGREVVIIDDTLELSDLDSCWASGFPRDIRIENRSKRDFLVYGSKDCTGEPVASVAPGTTATHNGWSGVAAG
ncbi:hypothetical protein DFR68_107533 [Nocardia mexicana]|uniref:Secreted protein n=1 Tax=Nocardia mexicana TaxID=279262 RepID=A0A370H0H7_9NOCA|nr:hypothetical protein DFR68_107533 [Nocardia mexicana]